MLKSRNDATAAILFAMAASTVARVRLPLNRRSAASSSLTMLSRPDSQISRMAAFFRL